MKVDNINSEIFTKIEKFNSDPKPSNSITLKCIGVFKSIKNEEMNIIRNSYTLEKKFMIKH